MGKSETSTSSIGIKILLSDLISQINEKNFKLIDDILLNGFIEDDNDYCNELYIQIMMYNSLPETWLEYKEYLETTFKTIKNSCLFDKYLLLPIKEILSTTRWGYDREGINGLSTSIDFDMSVNTDEYKELEKYNIVFILKQHSG
jgi:hypothetical protein